MNSTLDPFTGHFDFFPLTKMSHESHTLAHVPLFYYLGGIKYIKLKLSKILLCFGRSAWT